MHLERLYLDYNATSPLSSSVLDWLKSGEVLFANPSSQHSLGKGSRKVINETRSQIFSTFHQSEKDHHLMFHSGATEAFFAFAYSFSEWARQENRELLICFSQIDHPSVTSLKSHFFGPHVSFFELKRDQNLNYQREENLQILSEKKKASPHLIILYHHLWVHNETGVVCPLLELQSLKTIQDLYVHVDAVQSPGKIPDWTNLIAGDVWTYSGHKFGAFKGIGFSLFKKSFPFFPFLKGGGQQQGHRGGTENPQGVRSISLALKDLTHVDVEANIQKRRSLELHLQAELKDLGAIMGMEELKNSNTIYFYLNHLSSDVAVAMFDLHGLEISAGSACSSGAARASEVLLQSGKEKVAKNGLRISFELNLSEEGLNKIKMRLSTVFNKLRSS